MRLIGYRLDNEGNSMLLAVHRKEYYLRYRGEDTKVKLSYEMMKRGTYLDEVRDVPYFVLENRVYPIKSFEPLTKNRGV